MGSKIRHLKNAPIREAIIDIRVVTPNALTVDKLRDRFTPVLKDTYPVVKERRSFTATVGAMDGEPKISSANSIDGLLFFSDDNTRIVQTRLDGFSANRLKPYDNFRSFKAEAQCRWAQFRDFVKPERVLRIGLRYINDLEIPSSPLNLSDVFDSFEIRPLDNNPTLEGFWMRMLLGRQLPEEKGHTIIEAPPQSMNTNKIVFDIDVFRTFETPPSENELWASLDSLHIWKNDIFFGSLNGAHIKRYE